MPALGLFIPSCHRLIQSSPHIVKACIIIPIYQKSRLRLREVECLGQGHTASAWQRQISNAVFPTTLKCLFLNSVQGLVSKTSRSWLRGPRWPMTARPPGRLLLGEILKPRLSPRHSQKQWLQIPHPRGASWALGPLSHPGSGISGQERGLEPGAASLKLISNKTQPPESHQSEGEGACDWGGPRQIWPNPEQA